MTDESEGLDLQYPWYQIVSDSSLEQGDILYDFPIVIVKSSYAQIVDGKRMLTAIRIQDAIIVSQSCDLDAEKIENVILCPLYNRSQLEGKFQLPDKNNQGLRNIQQGKIEGLYLLPPYNHSGEDDQFKIVNFRETHAVPFQLVKGHLESQSVRVRVCPPYREHLAQAFGRFIMRIGFPKDMRIPK